MKPGDIVLANVPSGSSLPGKLRPALVLAVLPGAVEDAVLVCGISSRTDRILAGWDFQVPAAARASTGLKVPSAIRPSWLATFSAGQGLRRLGEVDPVSLGVVRERIVTMLSGPP
jgi:mRNA-degrading endonuclease toxin of MazEF toxin-antitoxin module